VPPITRRSITVAIGVGAEPARRSSTNAAHRRAREKPPHNGNGLSGSSRGAALFTGRNERVDVAAGDVDVAGVVDVLEVALRIEHDVNEIDVAGRVDVGADEVARHVEQRHPPRRPMRMSSVKSPGLPAATEPVAKMSAA